jgi:hypothetical protein
MNITFDNDISKESNQVFIALGGSKECIINDLLDILTELKGHYGKPIQGITIKSNGIKQVITPFWNGKPY